MGPEYKKRAAWGKISRRGRSKEEGSKGDRSMLHMSTFMSSISMSIYIPTYVHMDIWHIHMQIYSIIKSTKHCLKKGEKGRGLWDYNRGSEPVKTALFPLMAPFVVLMYAS
jgi:hypothetical protein